MEKNAQPFSEPHGVKFAFADDFNSFTIVGGKFYGTFKKNCTWHDVPEVPGTLKPSTNQSDASKTPLFVVSHVFRVSFASLNNRNELNRYLRRGIIMRYTSAGGQERISGQKATPLLISISEPEGYDGFQITVTGTQTDPECFI